MDKPIVVQFPRAVREVENVWIPLRDGARLAARLWLPEDAEADPVPAIVEYMPYRKRDLLRLRDQPMHHYFAGHGYAALRVDLRGAGDSDGVLGPHRRYRIDPIDTEMAHTFVKRLDITEDDPLSAREWRTKHRRDLL